MLAIRLPLDIEERLNRLTLETGRTKTDPPRRCGA